MELNVPTIAQRKAARRSQITGTEGTTSTSIQNIPPTPTAAVTETNPLETPQVPTKTSNHLTSSPLESAPAANRQASQSESPQLDKDTLMALARSMGLELASPKKVWTKHSYSVTPESKDKFSKYCETLGIKMQDGLEEALQDWFKKRELEFKAISEAKTL